jgi:hypothetical protein
MIQIMKEISHNKILFYSFFCTLKTKRKKCHAAATSSSVTIKARESQCSSFLCEHHKLDSLAAL